MRSQIYQNHTQILVGTGRNRNQLNKLSLNGHQVRCSKYSQLGNLQPLAYQKELNVKQRIYQSSNNIEGIVNQINSFCKLAVIQLAVGLIVFMGAPALAETTTVKVQASQDPGIFTIQKTLVEAWSILREVYYDSKFNGVDWDDELVSKLQQVRDSTEKGKAYEQLSGLVSQLGDPFTRIISPEDYHNFRINSDGEVQGVGLLIASDLKNEQLVVLAPLKGGPAEKAGIKSGDILVSVNDQSTKGWTGEKAALNLRGIKGTPVKIKFARSNAATKFQVTQPIQNATQEEQIKNDVKDKLEQDQGLLEKPMDNNQQEQYEINLLREAVQLSPVTSASLAVNDQKIGYIRLVTFSNNASTELHKAIESLKSKGDQKFILDLRGNPGGLVESSMDIASQFLDNDQTVFAIKGRPDDPVTKVNLYKGKLINNDPLIVLVNNDSASASEILAGALQDNHRAILLGDKTYGKGKMQSVYELNDGSGLFVTVAQYLSPLFHEIDKTGIQPDMACNIADQVNQMKEQDELLDGQFMNLKDIEEDKCVISAESVFASKP